MPAGSALRKERPQARPEEKRRTPPASARKRPRPVQQKGHPPLKPVRGGASSRSRARAPARASRAELSYFILLPTLALLLIGLVMVFSAGSVMGMGQGAGGYKYFYMQFGWALVGFGLMVFFTKFDYHKLGKLSLPGVVLSVGLLGMVLAIGTEIGGAKRWIAVGPLTLQPTELAKVALVVFTAYVLAVKGKKARKITHLLFPVGLLLAADVVLIMLQPDMGSALVLCFCIMLLFGVADTRPAHLLAIGGGGAALAAAFAVSAPYRRARLFSFVNPWRSPRGAGYQVIQSYIALGSGRVRGLGLGMSRQKFLYLPNAHTDFIFAIIGEELGLIGTLVVLTLIGILAYGGVRVARRAPDDMGRFLAMGLTGLIVIQAIVNMGGVTGLLPITGVPLPFVSAGGSSLVVCMASIGILVNISRQCRA